MQLYKVKKGTYLKGYKVQIFPNEYQKAYIERCFELVRYVWNWALEKELIQYELYLEKKVDKTFIEYYDLVKIYKIEMVFEKPFKYCLQFKERKYFS